jgi:PAS domain-containing protein
MLKADGSPFQAQVISIAIPEKDGNINQCRTAVIDITERKRAEEKIQESERRYHNLFESTSDIIQSVAP